ncbi:MAG: tetratricopeptide repeat protein [Treponema sp.]|jgi:putative GTP pyrophosphokinase|nr:tetratricopeptide repeat protein [Treponema sp.]
MENNLKNTHDFSREETENNSPPEKEALKREYDKYIDIRHHIVNDLKDWLDHLLIHFNSTPVVSGRMKNFESYFSKYLRLLKAGDNNPQITDLLGARIICPFIEDLSAVENIIKKHFSIVETEKKGHYTFKEFGYESIHILIKIPGEITEHRGEPGTDIAEIQIRTILQDAWAEVEHELVYKAEFSPFDEPMKRKLAAVNASLSLADIIFQEIRSYQRKYSKEMEKRRESFYNKIEEATDNLLFSSKEVTKKEVPLNAGLETSSANNISIDDLLVNALSAHNQNRFSEAISQYTKILELKPDNTICSIIYKHRGMANFACSQYNEAIDDFTNTLKLDEKSYKAAYYRGVVHSVLRHHLPAIEDYTLSLSLNPYQSFCLFRRGQAYYHIGDIPQALSDCEKSLALEPENNSAAKFKELLLEKLRM